MRILADRHHSGLTDSLVLLFQRRLGWEIFFQKSMDWYPEFWDLQPFRETAIQYLERELEGLPGITLEEFKNTKFDVLLCSVPQHVNMWIKLRDLYQPEAKLIMQVGNAWTFDNSFPIKNIMASAKIEQPEGFNVQEYHQEIPLNVFYYQEVRNTKKIYSFTNCLNTVDLYKDDWRLFLELEKLMPTWEFKSFGGQCRDSALAPTSVVADKIREATWIFNSKKFADGFGHVIHSAMAIGRPLIVNYSDYKDKLAGTKLTPGANCINVDDKSALQISEEIIRCSEPTLLTGMGLNIYNKFKEQVNYDQEELQIRGFLSNLQ